MAEFPPSPSNEALYPPLTLRQRVIAFLATATLPLAVAIGVFCENKERSWSHAANVAATRYLSSLTLDMPTFRTFIGAGTAQQYQKWALKQEHGVLTDSLPDGAKLHWIGPRLDKNKDQVLLYFHGGGYTMPARPDYFPFLSALRKDLSASLGDFGIAVLEYSLAPESPMPIQLRQANAALTHLLNKGIPPANIIIGGDSAGGNLVLQLLSHILHPLPSIPALPALAQPLAGALLISPWCASSVEAPSYTRNDTKDLLPRRFYKSVAGLVKEGLTPELEPYFESLLAPATWWNGLDGVCARVLITAGENECLLDDVLKMGAVISRHVQDTTTVAEPRAVHEEVIFKFAAGEGGTGKDYDTIVAFLSRSFGVGR